jgi:hypothetical protein
VIFHARIDYGVKKGAAVARLQHKMAGKPIYVFENGEVVAIPPDQIEINEPEKNF